MLGTKEHWKNVPTAASGQPTCSFMAQMILGRVSAVVLDASVIVSFSQKLEDVKPRSSTVDIGCTNINPILQVRVKF